VLQAECLLAVDDERKATMSVSVRFLQVVARTIERVDGRERVRVDALEAGGRRHVAWDEAVEREIDTGPIGLAALQEGSTVPIRVPGARREEAVLDAAGRTAGTVVRTWERLAGTVKVRGRRVAGGALRVTVEIANTVRFARDDRQAAQRRAFCSAHAVLTAGSGCRFVSLADPPGALRAAAGDCANHGLWPALAGPPGDDRTVLAAPIILEDHPRIASESPGDLFDGGEIEQLLTLSILAMTDEEKAAMREADGRTRAILDRTEALTRDELLALHGTLRDPGRAR
jgi:hydrogenase maturation protease